MDSYHRHEDNGSSSWLSRQKGMAPWPASGSRIMAVAKPARILALVSIILFITLLSQIFRAPPQIKGPGDLEQPMSDEPMNEGMSRLTVEGNPRLMHG